MVELLFHCGQIIVDVIVYIAPLCSANIYSGSLYIQDIQLKTDYNSQMDRILPLHQFTPKTLNIKQEQTY